MSMLIFVIGLLVGGLLTTVVSFWLLHVGTIQVDRSDPFDGPYLLLILSEGVHQVTNKHYVILKVKDENFGKKD